MHGAYFNIQYVPMLNILYITVVSQLWVQWTYNSTRYSSVMRVAFLAHSVHTLIQ